MGLLEKALKYKNKINRNGKKTIMDKIKGPAETKMDEGINEVSGEDIIFLDKNDLVEVNESELNENNPDNALSDEGFQSSDIYQENPGKAVLNGHEGKFTDFMVLYETGKEIITAGTREELFDIILFSVMGQIGVSSSSIMIPVLDMSDRWKIAESRGVDIEKEAVYFNSTEGILKELIQRKGIIDLEEFKDNDLLHDDYFRYISIDARLLTPLIYDNSLICVIILGNKLTSDKFLDEEKDFLNSIAEFSTIAYKNILYKEKNDSDIKSLEKEIGYIRDVEELQKKIISEKSIDGIKDIIQDKFKELAIDSYSIFAKDNSSSKYLSIISEREDRLMLNELKFSISQESNLINQITEAESPVIFDDYQKSKYIVEVFTDKQIKNMSMLRIFSFRIGGELLGFTAVFHVRDALSMEEIDFKIKRISDSILPYINLILNREYREGKYIDNIEHIFNRIEGEIKNADNLKIPLALILFSIKNFKRYHSLLGSEKAKDIINRFEKFIISRMSDGDFSVRYDRHKIMVVLPGKNKKYAVPFANAIINEIVQAFSTKEVQLLVTFLIAEFPQDGKDVHSLIDLIS